MRLHETAGATYGLPAERKNRSNGMQYDHRNNRLHKVNLKKVVIRKWRLLYDIMGTKPGLHHKIKT
jgi:hypothetical protein